MLSIEKFEMIKKIYRALKERSVRSCNAISQDALSSLLGASAITLLDIGAADAIEPRWRPFSKSIKYIGFEPDERSREKLNCRRDEFFDYKIFPYALFGCEKSVNINLCRKPQVSSLYQPNAGFVNRFPDAVRFDVMSVEVLSAVSLDSLGIEEVDFVKLDVQGAEKDVLSGATKTLQSVLGLELEVEFLELYKNQPLFGDLCSQLSKQGFEFIDFLALARWERSKHTGYGQCVFGDALFLRTPESIDFNAISISKISSYLSILVIYNRLDLIDTVLELMNENMRRDLSEFEVVLTKIKKRSYVVRKIFSWMQMVISMFGSRYNLHFLE